MSPYEKINDVTIEAMTILLILAIGNLVFLMIAHQCEPMRKNPLFGGLWNIFLLLIGLSI